MRCCEIVAICFCEISTKWYCGFARLVQDGAARSVRDGPCEAVKRGRYEIVLRDHETGLVLCEPACCLQPVGRGSSRRSKRTIFFHCRRRCCLLGEERGLGAVAEREK